MARCAPDERAENHSLGSEQWLQTHITASSSCCIQCTCGCFRDDWMTKTERLPPTNNSARQTDRRRSSFGEGEIRRCIGRHITAMSLIRSSQLNNLKNAAAASDASTQPKRLVFDNDSATTTAKHEMNYILRHIRRSRRMFASQSAYIQSTTPISIINKSIRSFRPGA